MKRLTGLFLVGLAALALTVFSGGALASTVCNTGPAPSPPLSGTVVGGLVVNAGDFCVLGGAHISGGVRVNEGGILIVCGSTINGGFTANGAAELIFGAEEINCAGDLINGAVRISNTGPGILPPRALHCARTQYHQRRRASQRQSRPDRCCEQRNRWGSDLQQKCVRSGGRGVAEHHHRGNNL